MPLSLGDFSATLTIHSNTRDITVELSGSSIDPPIISASPEYFSLDMSQNEIILDTIAISNTGASDLQFNILSNIISNDIDRENGIFLVSYSIESENDGWFSFLNFRSEDNDDVLLLGEEAEFKIILETKNEKTNIFVESLSGSRDEAEALISKINELLS